MTNIFVSILAFNEHVLLKKLDSTPKLIEPDLYNHNYDLLLEELNEYLTACNNQDLNGIADAAGDMFVVIWGIICKHGLHAIFLDQIIIPIIESNESKFCSNRDELKRTMRKARVQDISLTYGSYNGKFILVNNETGKLAKGINYKAPIINL